MPTDEGVTVRVRGFTNEVSFRARDEEEMERLMPEALMRLEVADVEDMLLGVRSEEEADHADQ